MRPELTSFQIECDKGITAALGRVGRQIAERRIDGISETYITGNIKEQDTTFWIYADGACFQAPHQHRIFERADYGSLGALGKAFIEALLHNQDRLRRIEDWEISRVGFAHDVDPVGSVHRDSKEQANLAHRDDIQTIVDFIDADEKRLPLTPASSMNLV